MESAFRPDARPDSLSATESASRFNAKPVTERKLAVSAPKLNAPAVIELTAASAFPDATAPLASDGTAEPVFMPDALPDSRDSELAEEEYVSLPAPRVPEETEVDHARESAVPNISSSPTASVLDPAAPEDQSSRTASASASDATVSVRLILEARRNVLPSSASVDKS